MAVLDKIELDDVDVVSKVETWLKNGANVSLFFRSTGSGEACRMTRKPCTLEQFSPAEIVAGFFTRARHGWCEETKTMKIHDEFHRTPRGKINHYLKVRGKGVAK